VTSTRDTAEVSRLDDFTNFPIEPDLLHLIRDGVGYWAGGPLTASDEVASVMDCQDARDMTTVLLQLDTQLNQGQPLTMRDLMRALLATELAWASAVLGDPTDWENITGRSDGQTLADLRRLQEVLHEAGAPLRYLHPFAQ
jgi:hypothetical protein